MVKNKLFSLFFCSEFYYRTLNSLTASAHAPRQIQELQQNIRPIGGTQP
jgi:hypothetical protein